MSDNAHCDGLPSEIYLHNGNADVLPPADFFCFRRIFKLWQLKKEVKEYFDTCLIKLQTNRI